MSKDFFIQKLVEGQEELKADVKTINKKIDALYNAVIEAK